MLERWNRTSGVKKDAVRSMKKDNRSRTSSLLLRQRLQRLLTDPTDRLADLTLLSIRISRPQSWAEPRGEYDSRP